METRNSRNPEVLRIRRQRISYFGIRFSLFILLLAGGCGAPGEPTPPSPPVPVAVTDLAAQQAGDAVQLTFTMPPKTVAGEHLAETPAIKILRGALKPDGSPDAKSFRTTETIPGALVGDYRTADKVQVINRVSPDELRTYPGAALAYRVRTRAGDPLPTISEYRVYRGEIDAASAAAAANDLSQAKWKSPLAFLASSPTNSYRDAAFDFGKTYLYTVRAVIPGDGSTVESSDSFPVIVTPRDIFPPAVPQGLVAPVLIPEPNAPLEVDLSWSINTETDLAGYHVYRSEQQDTPGQLLTPDLLLSPAYRDTSVQPGHRYWYAVTAVDRSGNESAPSARVAAEVAQPST